MTATTTTATMTKATRWVDADEEEEDVNTIDGGVLDPRITTTTTTSSHASQHKSSHSGGTLVIPPTHTSRVDTKGIKLVTSYRANPSNPSSLIKTITKIRVSKELLREHVHVEKRRQWKKFGLAATDEDQSNITIHSREDIFMEDPHADIDVQDQDPSKALAGNLNAFWAKQQQRQLERKYDVEGFSSNALLNSATAGGDDATGAKDGADGWHRVGADGKFSASGTTTNSGIHTDKYVPPSQRGTGTATLSTAAAAASSSSGGGGGGGLKGLASRMERSGSGGVMDGGNRADQNTLRVTNISEETTEADLQELFQNFGRISRVYLAKDKETMQSRGFAFVSFVHREDAARAMEKLQGYGYDHLILKLEWARPSAPKDPGSEATVFRSGYGKALAQDTKDKVSFASNLTK